MLAAFSSAFVCTGASAHDSWLLPAEFIVAANKPVRIAFCTGEHFPASEAAPAVDRLDEVVAATSDGRTAISGFAAEGNDLAARVVLKEHGLHAVGLALKPKFIELDAEGFTAYLRDENAGQALKLRVSRGQSDQPGRELYTKLAKTYVRVTNPAKLDDSKGAPRPHLADDSNSARATDSPTAPKAGNTSATESQINGRIRSGIPAIGHKLEIMAQSDPTALRSGDTLRVQLQFDGAPLSQSRLKLGREGLPPHTYVAEVDTDQEGFAEFNLPQPGVWYVRAHLIRPRENPTEADWESYWASITFEVQQR